MPTASPSRRSSDSALAGLKAEFRAAARIWREALEPDRREAADLARTDALDEWLRGRVGAGSAVALYCSQSPEPDTAGLILGLAERGVRVLLPVLGPDAAGKPRREPDWAWYEGPAAMRVGLWGIPEPTSTPLGASALGEAEVILCSGLAATRAGARLGTGGGWYDRALARAREGAPIVVLLYDEEVVADLPTEAWDRPVTAIATPSGVLDCNSG